MKVTIKTTQQKVFQIDVDPAESIADLKAKIEQSHAHPAASQKIIYSGKILTDDKTIDSCGIKEKDFLVLMVSKPKPTPAPAHPEPAQVAEQSTPAAPSLPPSVAAPIPAPSTTEPAPAAPAPDAQPPASDAPAPAFVDQTSFLSGDRLQSAINNLVEMGFPRDQVLRAMRASFNNPDRAAEYLMTGIPAHLEAEAAPQPPAATAAPTLPANPAAPAAAAPAPAQPQNQPQNLFQLAQQQQQAGSGAQHPAAPTAAGPGGLNFEALQNNPQIQQLREQIRRNPELIQPLIQQLATQNPAIAQMIAQNPEALFQLLGVELDDEDGAGPVPPGAHVVNVTEEERAAILRLEALGFPRQAVLEAYFACDKNEELAANYLFESQFDD
ncbi:unnamed protein product [Cyclocybe aegerita]|uniref:UV excision repair protein RAD23 n=1 Tax=Cyclocybe aegerita TaxID=1973307 RepID=A0A8S0WAK5_CYCAE|nr:unnamed protein product [Cyclocybe aegerita]